MEPLQVRTEARAPMSEYPTLPTEPLYAAMAAGGVAYQPWEGLPLEPDRCFVCGRTLDADNRTSEDVFPRWLQRDLRGLPERSRRPLLLPNMTGIALNQVLIPACSDCNGIHLSRLEDRVSSAFRTGPSAVRVLTEGDVRQWCAKIAYGCRVNDMRLEADRRNSGLKLATPTEMIGLANLHWLLQEVRDVVRVGAGHSTFWIFESPTINCASCDWDVALPTGWPNVVMFKHRGSVIMGAADDRGSLLRLREHPAFVAAGSLPLHKVQVRALLAILITTANSLSSADYPLRYRVSDNRVWIERVPSSPRIDAVSDQPQSLASRVLANLIGVPLETVEGMGGPTGYLLLPNGDPREMPVSC